MTSQSRFKCLSLRSNKRLSLRKFMNITNAPNQQKQPTIIATFIGSGNGISTAKTTPIGITKKSIIIAFKSIIGNFSFLFSRFICSSVGASNVILSLAISHLYHIWRVFANITRGFSRLKGNIGVWCVERCVVGFVCPIFRRWVVYAFRHMHVMRSSVRCRKAQGVLLIDKLSKRC